MCGREKVTEKTYDEIRLEEMMRRENSWATCFLVNSWDTLHTTKPEDRKTRTLD